MRKIIDIGRARLEVVEQGQGEDVVLLSGMGTNVSDLDPVASCLNDAGFRTIGINYRGVGNSSGMLDGATLHDFSDDIAEAIAMLKLAPVHVVGAATGNRVVRCLSVDHPHLVKTATLLGAGGLVAPDPEAAAALRRLFQTDLAEHERFMLARIALFAHDENAATLRLLSAPEPVLHEHARIFLGTPVSEWWHAGDAPIHVIQALDDRIAPPENGRLLVKEYGSRVCLSELQRGGHLFFLADPEGVAHVMADYFRARRA